MCKYVIWDTLFLEDSNSEEKSSSENEREETEHHGTLEDQVLTLCRVVRENLVDFIKDPHGSHVLRTLIHVLAGCSAQEQSTAHLGGRTESTVIIFCMHFWFISNQAYLEKFTNL